MYNKLNFYQRSSSLIILCIFLLTLSGCSVKYIADYDQIIDQTVISLQTRVETFLTQMERTAGTPEGEYVNQTKFYDDIKGTLETLSVRAATIPQNEIITEQINLLNNNIERLRKIHERQQEKGLTKAHIDPIKTALETQFKSIYQLEEALKRGQSTSNK